MARSGSYLFAALLAFATAEASDDLSGRWKIRYAVESIGTGDLSEGSLAYLSEKDGTLQGRMILGRRSDGYLIGYCTDSSFRATITFRHDPAMFVRLTGCNKGGELQEGRFTASSCEGGFWKGASEPYSWSLERERSSILTQVPIQSALL